MKPEIIDTMLDGQVIKLKNCVPDDLDHNDLFNNYEKDFNFPNPAVGQLHQYSYPYGHNDKRFDPIRKLLEIPDNYSAKIGLHEISAGGFIPPHADKHYYGGLTIFLNYEWDIDWGGWGMAYNDTGIITTVPSYGDAVFYKTPLLHCTAPVYVNDKVRRSIQIFYIEDNKWDDLARE
jgi:hypothetical protein